MPHTAQDPRPDLTLAQKQRFHAAYSVLHQAIASQAFPGAAFGLLHHREILLLDAAGRFTYDTTSPPVTPHTVYDLASVTKVVATTAAAMLLYDRGTLDLDTPLGEILPAFVIGTPDAALRIRVTLRHLLAHSSGLPGYARLFEAAHTPNELLTACLQLPLEAPPNTRAEYSDLGFILLGKALELLAREPLEIFCHREIFQPLGLTTTQYNPPAGLAPAIPPTEHDTVFRHRVIQGEVQDEHCAVLGGVSGHAGLFANVRDLLNFSACILNRGKTSQGQQLFQPSTVELFATRQPAPLGTTRALGWDTPSPESSSGRYFGPRSIGHLGYAGTSLWLDLDRQLAVALLTNRTWPDRSSQQVRAVRPAFHNALLQSL